jgi:FixJ family two-component response regulator
VPNNEIIAVVDDDESMRLSLRGLVRSLGYAVECFPSADAFLASPSHRSCACVISDIQMPGLSGLELQERMRALRPETPFIFVTAYGDERTQARAMQGGANCFLRKPFDAAALIACLERALHKA